MIASEAVKRLRYDEVECNPSAEKENINSKSNSRKYSNCIDYKRVSVIIILYYTDDNEY